MERSVFRRDVNTNNNWTFELRISGEWTPIFEIVGFQARKKFDSQAHNNASFDRLPFSIAVCNLGPQNCLVDGTEGDYDRNKNDQA